MLYSSHLFRAASYDDFTSFLHLYTQLQNRKSAKQYASKKQYDRSLKVQEKKKIIKTTFLYLTDNRPKQIYLVFKYLLRKSSNSQFTELPWRHICRKS